MKPSPAQGLKSDHAPITFGRYQLVRRIGAGGMGEVFLARDESSSQPRACVVKKVLRHLVQNPNFIKRFLDESKVVVRLSHPNIARVYAMGEVSGEYFLAMEYVQGKTLSRFARRLRDRKQRMPVGMILLLGEKICQGLAYAHDAGDEQGNPLQLVHRDLSPANVCVGYAGEVKIIDFGAAQSTLKEAQTAPRVVIGNLTYMAPEQAQKHHVDRRADVYSLGATLWELFAWKPLSQKGAPLDRWRRAANPSWQPASDIRPDLPPEVDAILARALSKDPDARYPDARELLRALARLRARVAPDVKETHLAQLLSAAFAAEKVAEDEALRELLGGVPLSEAPTEMTKRMRFVPSTALAFEHRAVAPPALASLDAELAATDPFSPVTHEDLRESRVGFGLTIAPPPQPEEEQELLRELMGDEPEGDAVDLESSESSVDVSLESSVPPGPPTRPERPAARVPLQSRPAPISGQTATVPRTPSFDEAPDDDRPAPWRWWLIGAGVFLGGLTLGFLAVMLLA